MHDATTGNNQNKARGEPIVSINHSREQREAWSIGKEVLQVCMNHPSCKQSPVLMLLQHQRSSRREKIAQIRRSKPVETRSKEQEQRENSSHRKAVLGGLAGKKRLNNNRRFIHPDFLRRCCADFQRGNTQQRRMQSEMQTGARKIPNR